MCMVLWPLKNGVGKPGNILKNTCAEYLILCGIAETRYLKNCFFITF